ncbi:MAG: hypothetical protein HC853_01575 [Anaerolineae bacterium]|nr:hypothetical protein [Anaerolineae bacterium]
MSKQKFVALVAAGLMLFASVSTASAGVVAVNRAEMSTAYSSAQHVVANGEERQFIVAAARVAVAAVTRVARTPGVRQIARDAATFAFGFASSFFANSRASGVNTAGQDLEQVFD